MMQKIEILIITIDDEKYDKNDTIDETETNFRHAIITAKGIDPTQQIACFSVLKLLWSGVGQIYHLTDVSLFWDSSENVD